MEGPFLGAESNVPWIGTRRWSGTDFFLHFGITEQSEII